MTIIWSIPSPSTGSSLSCWNTSRRTLTSSLRAASIRRCRSRLRARGQITEIGAAELAFTQEEAVAFLRGVMDLDLSTEEVATLEEATEGWIAGLQLAALSMRDRKDVSGFIESFSGSHRDVLDFLAEEVLERQPDDVRE